MEMAQTKLTVLAALLITLSSCGPRFEWQKHIMDGHRTGVTAVAGFDYPAALGTVDSVYSAPNGRVFDCGSTPTVAKLLLDVQPDMAYLKEILAYAPYEMRKYRPESELGNWTVDALMKGAEFYTGRKVDVGFFNIGGIRQDIPQGSILLDDIVSMYPFKNYVCYLRLQGSDIRYIVDFMARREVVEAVGGIRFAIRDRKAEDITVGGLPLDDNKEYGVATIDFILDGGDSLYVARNARELIITDKIVVDWMVPYVKSCTSVEYSKDGRVTIE